MKKILLLFVFAGQFTLAQQVTIQSVVPIKNTENGGFFYSKFSSTGDYLLVTAENYAGLKLYSFSDNSIKTITQDAGAGYGVQTSADDNTIVYQKNEFVKNLKNTSLVSYSKTSGNKVQLVAPTREPITAKFAANKPQYVKGKILVAKNITTIESTPVICIEDQKMVIYSGNIRKVLTPNGQNASYIWPSISPDRKNIAYTVAGKGTFVCNVNGLNPVSLGKLSAPVWLNNQWLVGMDDKDDGEKLISSTLVALSINGKVRQALPTPANKMAMYPTASSDGSRIVFNTEKGELYLLNVQVK